LSPEPTYTTPFAIAGEEKIDPAVAPVHKGLHVFGEPEHPVVPVALKASRRPSLEPMYTTPLTTAGDESMLLAAVPVHSGLQVVGVPEQPEPVVLKA